MQWSEQETKGPMVHYWTHNMGVPDGEERKKKIIWRNNAPNFPNLMEDMNYKSKQLYFMGWIVPLQKRYVRVITL